MKVLDHPRFATVLIWSALIIGCCSVVAVFLHASQQDLELFFSSDTLYLPSIYRDVFLEHGRFWEWSFNAAPNFLPDMGLYFLLNWVFGSFKMASYVFPIVQFLLVALLFRAIVRRSAISTSDPAIAVGMLMLALMVLTGWQGDDFGFAFHLLVNSFHGGALVNALFCTWLLLIVHGTSRWSPWLWLALAVAVGSASDRLFWVMFTVPSVCVLLLLSLRPAMRWRLVCMAALVALVSWLSYSAMLNLLRSMGAEVEAPYAYMAFERVSFSWGRFMDSMRFYLTNHWMVGSLVAIALLTMAGMAVSAIREVAAWARGRVGEPAPGRGSARLVKWMAALAMPLLLFVPVINGSYDGMDSLRYNYGALVLANMVAGLWLGKALKAKASLLALVASLVIGIPVLCSTIEKGGSGYGRLLGFKPSKVQEFDRLAAGAELDHGAADYWSAKLITLFSDRNVTVLPVFPDLALYVHVNRKGMFLHKEFNFVVTDPAALTKEGMMELFSQDTGFREGQGLGILLTRPWHYDETTGKVVIP